MIILVEITSPSFVLGTKAHTLKHFPWVLMECLKLTEHLESVVFYQSCVKTTYMISSSYGGSWSV